jgi:uncharacterized protein YdhG (YjbR/CyaY superfamily)
MNTAFTTVDEYIKSFPGDTQLIMKKVREVIKTSAPDAVESISYGMPAYKLEGKPLVYFGAFKSHIGFYATPTGHAAFIDELSTYKQGKGSVQFPLNKPIPYDLIKRIVAFRIKEVEAKKK